jgi:hypothetical protein
LENSPLFYDYVLFDCWEDIDRYFVGFRWQERLSSLSFIWWEMFDYEEEQASVFILLLNSSVSMEINS